MSRNGRFDSLGSPTHGTYYSKSRAERQQLICTTYKSDYDIEQFNRRWLRNNPTYGVIGELSKVCHRACRILVRGWICELACA